MINGMSFYISMRTRDECTSLTMVFICKLPNNTEKLLNKLIPRYYSIWSRCKLKVKCPYNGIHMQTTLAKVERLPWQWYKTKLAYNIDRPSHSDMKISCRRSKIVTVQNKLIMVNQTNRIITYTTYQKVSCGLWGTFVNRRILTLVT